MNGLSFYLTEKMRASIIGLFCLFRYSVYHLYYRENSGSLLCYMMFLQHLYNYEILINWQRNTRFCLKFGFY